MTTLFDSARLVKPARDFGILPARERRMPFTQADLDWAAQFLGELEDNRRLEDRALQAAWDDQFIGTMPMGPCEVCGMVAELTNEGLCDRCDRLPTHATIALQNQAVMGMYRVF